MGNEWLDFFQHERQAVISRLKKQIKVFQLNDCDWWAGYDLESVKKAYVKETGMSLEEAFDDPRELTDEEMDTLKHWGDEGDNKEPITFRQELDRMIESGFEFPWFFASTER